MSLWFFRHLLWSLFTCCPPGDDKLHVNVFVPSGSDESDCTPGILFVCQSPSVCVFVYHSGNGGPPATAVILIKVFFCFVKSSVSVCYCVLVLVFCLACCFVSSLRLMWWTGYFCPGSRCHSIYSELSKPSDAYVGPE